MIEFKRISSENVLKIPYASKYYYAVALNRVFLDEFTEARHNTSMQSRPVYSRWISAQQHTVWLS